MIVVCFFIYIVIKEVILMARFVTYKRYPDGYGEICLNRPEKRNAISRQMQEELSVCLDQAEGDTIKYLVITGAGNRMFCAGGDLFELHGNLSPEQAYEILRPMQEVMYRILKFPVPTICLLNGDALGGGCEIATACDIRIAREQTKFGFVQTRIGILPGWGGGALLYQKVNPSFALRWLMGGHTFDAQELKECGWIHRIVTDSDWFERSTLLQDYTSKSRKQMELLKEQFLNRLIEQDLAVQMSDEVKNSASLWDSPEHKAAIEKFFSRK